MCSFMEMKEVALTMEWIQNDDVVSASKEDLWALELMSAMLLVPFPHSFPHSPANVPLSCTHSFLF